MLQEIAFDIYYNPSTGELIEYDGTQSAIVSMIESGNYEQAPSKDFTYTINKSEVITPKQTAYAPYVTHYGFYTHTPTGHVEYASVVAGELAELLAHGLTVIDRAANRNTNN